LDEAKKFFYHNVDMGLAILKKSHCLIELLINNGCSVNIDNNNEDLEDDDMGAINYSYLGYEVIYGHKGSLKLIKLLLKHGADIHYKNEIGETPLISGLLSFEPKIHEFFRDLARKRGINILDTLKQKKKDLNSRMEQLRRELTTREPMFHEMINIKIESIEELNIEINNLIDKINDKLVNEKLSSMNIPGLPDDIIQDYILPNLGNYFGY